MRLIICLASGLANRMFQYSYFLYLKKRGYNVLVDYAGVTKLPHENVDWQRIFVDATFPQASKKDVLLCGGGVGFLSRAVRKLFPGICKTVQMASAFDYELPNLENGTYYILGVFQSSAVVESVRDEVLSAFRFNPFGSKENEMLAKEMSGCESVAIHVRKGDDYQQRPLYHNTCPLQYYVDAVKLMREHLKSPRFYVFTDNEEWVKENFGFFDYILVNGNPTVGYGSHWDMQLMSCCRHNVISNSTYSWWGAYLNANIEKIVIAPKVWFNPECCDDSSSEKTVCKGWVTI